MTEKLSAPRGTRDLYGEEMARFEAIETLARAAFSSMGYQQIRTPIFESRSLFERSVGDETDIVKKELYVFRDRKDRELALRPEGTAGVVRAYIERNMGAAGGVTKLWYSGPMFRYERPQGGRYRQFYQLGCELFGAKSAMADVEVAGLAIKILATLKINARLKINFIGCEACRRAYAESIRAFFAAKKEKLCPDCIVRLERNPLRVLDCKVETCRAERAGAPAIALCETCSAQYAEIRQGLSEMKIEYVEDASMVRGLDYYTGFVFEAVSENLGAQDAVLGGGRYDGLVAQMGGPPTPAVGFAIGMDRLASLVAADIRVVGPFLLVIGLGAQNQWGAMDLARRLRAASVVGGTGSVECALSEKSLKAQLKDADRRGFPFVAILGDGERERGVVTIRDMKSGEQKEIATGVADDELAAGVRRSLLA